MSLRLDPIPAAGTTHLMIAVVFPGQGSQKPGMGRELHDSREEAARVFELVSDATGRDMAALCFDSTEEALRQTENAQLALFTVSVAAWRCLQGASRDLPIAGMAGHSVGEYAALCAAGVLQLEVAARLVQRRGQVMAEAGKRRPGTMAAVLSLGREELETICGEAGGIVVVANDNCPGQLVISGEVEAVKRAGELAQTRGAKRVLSLNVSGAFHSPLMDEASKSFAEGLKEEDFSVGEYPVYANATAEPAMDAERWPRLLEEQLRSPVRWTETVQNMARDGMDTFIECGPGEVLGGLIRRVGKEHTTLNVSNIASLEKTLSVLAQPVQ